MSTVNNFNREPNAVQETTSGEAARLMGDRYREGDGVEQDLSQARHWYELAAKEGDAAGQNNLGTMYLEGIGGEVDAKTAVYWYQRSADQGFEVAQYNLGKRYLHGKGVEKDEEKAFHWIMLAAEQGDLAAMVTVGAMFRLGCGTAPNLARAALWHIEGGSKNDPDALEELASYKDKLELMALTGNRLASFALARMCEWGLGCDMSREENWAWLRHAHDFCSPILVEEHPKAEWLNDHIAADFHAHTKALDEEDRAKGEALLLVWLSSAGMALVGRSQVILDVCAEGGGVTLMGQWTSKGWRFKREVMDQTPELIDEPWIEHTSEVIESWRGALRAMDRYPWHTLYPISVHPEFSERVWQAYLRRIRKTKSNDYLQSNWEEICHRF
jgi:hypothetical protein